MTGFITTYFKNELQDSKNPFFFIFVIDFIYSAFVALVVGYFAPSAADLPIDGENIWVRFSVSVIFGPILETLLFQVLIMETMRSYKIRDLYTILASGLLFSLSHSYNIIYVLVTLFPGLLYAFYYTRLRRNMDWFSSAFFVFSAHSLYNLFVLMTKL